MKPILRYTILQTIWIRLIKRLGYKKPRTKGFISTDDLVEVKNLTGQEKQIVSTKIFSINPSCLYYTTYLASQHSEKKMIYGKM